jgi:hypothetical protein
MVDAPGQTSEMSAGVATREPRTALSGGRRGRGVEGEERGSFGRLIQEGLVFISPQSITAV